MGRRTVLLIAALVVAALGTVLVFLYASNADERAQENVEQVKVLVAKTQVNPGTAANDAAEAGAFEETTIAKGSLVPGALSSITPIQDQVALVPIYPGQQIIAQQWGTSSQLTQLALPEGKIAVSLALGDPERVAGFVNPGSTVAIFATGGPAVRLLLADITVLGVGTSTLNAQPTDDAEGGEEVSTAVLTLAVTQGEAEKIIAAQGLIAEAEYDGLYFALMDDTSELEVGTRGASVDNLFPN